MLVYGGRYGSLLHATNAKDTERIPAIMSDDASDDDGTECDGGYVETTEGDAVSAEDVTSDGHCCTGCN